MGVGRRPVIREYAAFPVTMRTASGERSVLACLHPSPTLSLTHSLTHTLSHTLTHSLPDRRPVIREYAATPGTMRMALKELDAKTDTVLQYSSYICILGDI